MSLNNVKQIKRSIELKYSNLNFSWNIFYQLQNPIQKHSLLKNIIKNQFN